MNNIKELELCEVEIYSGQIMSRIVARERDSEKESGTIKVVVPKCIREDGSISASEMSEEIIKSQPDEKRITNVGDIVIKLSTPYDAGIIDEESAGAVIPSFCAIIKNSEKILLTSYLLACLNSSVCKEQMQQSTGGTSMSILSVGRIKSLRIPVPPMNEQKDIGRRFLATQAKLKLIKEIAALEAKRNSIFFMDLVKKYE